MLEQRTPPMQSEGHVFTGVLLINQEGLIEDIKIIVGYVVFDLNSNPDWISANFPFTYNDILRWREVVKNRYKDKLSKDLI